MHAHAGGLFLAVTIWHIKFIITLLANVLLNLCNLQYIHILVAFFCQLLLYSTFTSTPLATWLSYCNLHVVVVVVVIKWWLLYSVSSGECAVVVSVANIIILCAWFTLHSHVII